MDRTDTTHPGAEDAGNVIRLPIDWIGPLEELVPISGTAAAARAEAEARAEAATRAEAHAPGRGEARPEAHAPGRAEARPEAHAPAYGEAAHRGHLRAVPAEAETTGAEQSEPSAQGATRDEAERGPRAMSDPAPLGAGDFWGEESAAMQLPVAGAPPARDWHGQAETGAAMPHTETSPPTARARARLAGAALALAATAAVIVAQLGSSRGQVLASAGAARPALDRPGAAHPTASNPSAPHRSAPDRSAPHRSAPQRSAASHPSATPHPLAGIARSGTRAPRSSAKHAGAAGHTVRVTASGGPVRPAASEAAGSTSDTPAPAALYSSVWRPSSGSTGATKPTPFAEP
jgi:hypothetical protein